MRTNSLAALLGVVTLASAANLISVARAAGPTTVLVQLEAGPGVLFNHRGPSKLRLTTPFGETLEQPLQRGAPLASDPDNYDTSVPPLRFALKIPPGAVPGAHPLHVQGELFLCDAIKHACFRTAASADGVLQVGADGAASAAPIVVRAASIFAKPQSPRADKPG